MTIALVLAFQTIAGVPDGQAAVFGGDYVWWYMEKLPWRDRDGGMRVLYSLNLPAEAQVTAEPQVYYRAQKRRRYNAERRQSPPPARIFQKQLEQRDGRYFMEVYSGSTQNFEVRLEVELDGKPYYAQTSFSLGGSSDRADFGVTEVETWPDGPEISLADPRQIRARMEEEVSLRLSRAEAPEIISVFDQTGGILARAPVVDGLFSYIAAYDQKLASAGPRGRNHAIFVARLPDDKCGEAVKSIAGRPVSAGPACGGVVTYYLPIHRNLQLSHSSVPAGLIVVGVTAAICLCFIWLARRRFRFK